jgi:hypothetical protein
MTIRRLSSLALATLVLWSSAASDTSAQVVEERDSEANPAAAIFRATLFGAGTGLLLGGAYALVEEGDATTGEILRWGVAGGAAAGVVVGLIYWATRSEPEGSAEDVDTALLRVKDGDLQMDVPALRARALQDVGGIIHPTIEASLLQVSF